MSSLTISDVSKSFGSTNVLNNLSLDISSGEFFFLLGPSGCGKSTLLRIIAGLERPDTGRVSIDGRDVTELAPQERGVGMVFQQYALWPHMTIAQNIRFGLETLRISAAARHNRMLEALSLVRMEAFAHRYPHQISGGQQQRVALARALAMQPRIILLDEPLSNLDATLRQEIREELLDLHRRLQTTMIYVTHDQEDALVLGTRIALLNGGVLEQIGTPEEIYSHPNTTFVARFIGESNLIPGTLHQDSEHIRTVVLDPQPSSPISIGALGAGSAPGRGFLCVRPEAISIEADLTKQPGVVSLPARVIQKSFRGSHYNLTLSLGDESTIRTVLPVNKTPPPLSIGSLVSVSWSPQSSVFLSR